LSARTTGHHTWTEDEIAQFCARHAIGTRARLAIEIFLTTGVRRSDVVRLGRQHQRQGWIRFRPYKGRNRWDAVVEIPMLPALEAVIAASPVGDLTWLVNDRGQPFTVAGFGNWFRDRCNEAGLQHCTSHGLRKAAATAAAERGATAHQLMAIFGWLSLKEAEVYTRSAERKRMAAMGMQHMTRDGNSGP
jgi:integrase